ncbi:hypothetical protein, partial [Staphylococcus aureus]
VVLGISFDTFKPLIIAACLYFVLNFSLSRLMSLIEGRLKSSD